MLADLEGLLRKLLYVPGILEDIMKTLKDIKQSMTCDTISDIYSGEIYKKQFVNENTRDIQLTCILNTDGVNLYKSSKVELWPVYLAINELHASHRFSRENILLIALWQGKGKPPFKIYFEQIIEEINTLTEKGLQMDCGEENWNVYMNVIGITLDLPAKAGVLNMTQFNGLEACITCEEPGLVVRQGRGHSRCYPYRPTSSRFPERSVEGVLESMESATVRNRQKGFKGMSGIARLLKFELVYGIVPDYMHCVLLGIVKTILSKWFSPTQSGNDYFVGKHLKQINERLLQIQPPHYIERLPRDIEKHYANYKATELQAFLLFYALPCLTGIQKENFLQHLALLSEAIFILLGDSLTQNCLERSELLLGQFYSQFSELYGEGSCGLNVHNACAHLPMYVRKLGPVWAWSCFGFEDANANILQSVHGTGDVVKQALRKQETALYVRSSNKIQLKSLKHLKVSHQAQNCAIIGSLKSVCSNLPDYVYEALGVESCVNLKKVLRIFVNNKTFYSFAYSRMKKRNSYTVLYSEDEIGQIQYFVLNLEFNLVYAVISKMNECVNSWLSNFQGAKHLKCVVKTNCHRVVYVDQLKATLIYMKSPTGDCGVIARLPNTLGHAIFK
ncbi:uncharacterized protein LOC132759444 [Ruditapes philippinarum]|uniref:uncharacterized protein LOC132759444 n=1 Tax=Ruditapes philippinarum TaxID=129788 RepID=UPI00295AD006|nr:uncharacterized protein LOC132759444 [Ruditapes philippinarum]